MLRPSLCASLALALVLLPACGSESSGPTDEVPREDACEACDAGGDASPVPDTSMPDSDAPDVPDTDGPAPDTDIPWDPEGDDDGDGILNGIEGMEDADGDGVPNYLDLDSDGDGIPDAIEYGQSAGSGEPPVDTDDDGVPDFLDLDSDGDGILDRWEGADDRDGDGVPNFRDLDSDGDGWPDAVEYGRSATDTLPPLDTDNDGIFDFLDLDSDGDGLPDEVELGCPESTERLLRDSDGDGLSDLVETVFSTDPADAGRACDPDRGIEGLVDFYFELPFDGPTERDQLDFVSDVRNADVLFNIDTTGSMGGEITRLREGLNETIIPGLGTRFEDVGYGVSQFDDFPCNGHGSGADRPFRLRQRITTSVAQATAGVNAITQHFGGDFPESGIESLFQAATGVGRRNQARCLANESENRWLVPPFDPTEGFEEGVADGDIGGAGFRFGSVPVIVHITDAISHAKGESADGFRVYPFGASRPETMLALRNIGAKVVGVSSAGSFNGDIVREELEAIATATGARVPPCAWDGDRPTTCPERACCTGTNGEGRPPDADGLCPIVYDISTDGTGLGESTVAGIRALVDFSTFDLITRARGDADELALSGIDTSCFIDAVRPIRVVPPDAACVQEPSVLDINRDGIPEGFAGVVLGSELVFEIQAVNRCVEPSLSPRIFLVWIDIVEPRGSAVLDSRLVTILVPPDFKE